MADWNPPSDEVLAPGKPGRSSHIIAIRDLAEAVAQRADGAPHLNAATNVDFLTTSGTYTVPSGVYRIKVYVVGAGGQLALAGGNSDFQHPDGTTQGNGGGTEDGGTATGGDMNIQGASFVDGNRIGGGNGAGPYGGGGGIGGTGGQNGVAPGGGGTGGGGGCAIKIYTVTPGQQITYSIGAGGSGGSTNESADGGIIVEY